MAVQETALERLAVYPGSVFENPTPAQPARLATPVASTEEETPIRRPNTPDLMANFTGSVSNNRNSQNNVDIFHWSILSSLINNQARETNVSPENFTAPDFSQLKDSAFQALEAMGVPADAISGMRRFVDANLGDFAGGFRSGNFLAPLGGSASFVRVDGNTRATVNNSILATFESCDQMAYGLGSKGQNGRIDCSGFIQRIATNLDRGIGGRNWSGSLADMSENQYLTVAREVGGTGALSSNSLERMIQNGQLQGGMIIAMDVGSTRSGFDAGRSLGIDHIVMTVERNGQLYIAESRGGAGVTMMPAQDWIDMNQRNETRRGTDREFYVTDFAAYASRHEGIAPAVPGPALQA